MDTGRLVWILTLDTESGSASGLALAYKVHFPFEASALLPLMRELNKVCLEAGQGDRLDPAHQSQRHLRRVDGRQICL